MRHGILFHIAEKILDNSPQTPAVCIHILGILRIIFYQLKSSRFKPFDKFTTGLHKQFFHINPTDIQHNIARTGPRCLHQIFRQLFEPLGFLIQHNQILIGFFIVQILPFQKVYIVDNRSKRCLQIVGHIGDQIRLHPFTFHLFL